jgi:hypothetical protein
VKYIQILLLLLIVSCQNQESNKQEKLKVDFFDHELNWAVNKPVLRIYFESNECGEYGGHEEHITVSKKDNQKYKLEYEKYQVNCDSAVKLYNGNGYRFRPLNTLIVEKEIVIYENEKQAILDFANDMLKSKFKEEEIMGHAEIKMSISNSDSTFFIWKYGGEEDIYRKLLNGLRIN